MRPHASTDDGLKTTRIIDHATITHRKRLLALRVVWGVLFGGYLLIAILGIPSIYHSHTIEDPLLIAQYAELGIHHNLFAVYLTGTILAAVFAAATIGGVLFYRTSDSWFISYISITFLIAALSPNNTQQVVAYAYPVLQWPAWVLAYVAVMVYSSVGWLFPDGRFVPGWSRRLIYFYAIMWLYTIPRYVELGTPENIQNFLIKLLNTSTIILGLVAIAAQYARYRNAEPVTRQQLKWAIFGVVVWFGFFIIRVVGFMFIIPAVHSFGMEVLLRFIFASIPNYGTILTVAALAFAITRYRLWDVDIFINRSLVYAGVTSVLGMIFLASIFLIQRLLGAENTLAAFAISAVGPVLLFNWTRKQSQHFIDRRIYGWRFDLNELNAAQKALTISNPGQWSGHKLGEYEVLDVIGEGGMGEVYKGVGNGKTVAIKTVLPDLAEDETTRIRFEREVEWGMAMDHPSIAKIYGQGIIENTPYMVMEYIDGYDLKELLREHGTLDLQTVGTIMKDVCSALDSVHRQGVIHRDLKPSNIMLRSDGSAVLMDFGISKSNQEDVSITGTGAIGTIAYMSPEQIQESQEVDPRTDIYGLGIVIYELLTGQLPFTCSPIQMVFAHLQQPPNNPRAVNETIPEHVSDAILKALSKKPEERFESISEFLAALSFSSADTGQSVS